MEETQANLRLVNTDREDKRTELLNCALRLFVAYGYDATGVQQIVERADVTTPALHHCFVSKVGFRKLRHCRSQACKPVSLIC